MSLQQPNFLGNVQIPTEFPFDTNCGPAAGSRSIFAAFLSALHQSRRLKAERVIHQHRHLIADLRARNASGTPG
jgi:hypothetical protein